jgi:serine/threonine protein kinase
MHQPYTVSPDYWTLGIIIHEMITGDAPYDRTYKNHSNTSEYNSQIDSTEDDYRSISTIENETSDIIRPSSRHYNM